MARHSPVYIPLVVEIDNRDKHLSRFAIRAKAMTLPIKTNMSSTSLAFDDSMYLVSEARDLIC